MALGTAVAAGAQAADCAGNATTHLDINVSAGVYTERAQVSAPMKLRVPTGVDARTLAECLRLERGGAPPAVGLEKIAECRREATSVRIRHTDGVHALTEALDEAAFAACLEGGVEVELVP
ncbi:MAG: hypothetical protein AB7O21_20515 [Gammaproteobacteria bacterium]